MTARQTIENLWDRATPVAPLLDAYRHEVLREATATLRELHHPITHMGQDWCAECSVRRSTGPRTEEWIAYIPHPCPTLHAIGVQP